MVDVFHGKRILAFALLGLVVGCSDGPPLASVTGVVTHREQPVSGVNVYFQPENGRPSWAMTDAEGRFTLQYSHDQKGALLGRHKVWIQPVVFDERDPQAASAPSPPPFLGALLPKYGRMESSPLEVEVDSSTRSLTLVLE